MKSLYLKRLAKEKQQGFLKRFNLVIHQNMAEIGINIVDRQCTGGRIENKKPLAANVMIWSKDSNKPVAV